MNGLIDYHIADLLLLVRVADASGFTAAARVTGYPQATISRRIAQLEKQLGVRLLDRSTRRVALTDAGHRVCEHARLMLDQAEVIRSVAHELQAEPSGTLRIVSPVVLGQAFVGQVVAQFMALHSKVKVKLELSSRNMDLIDEGFDVAIRIGRVPDSSLAMHHIGTVRTALFATPAYIARAPAIAEPEDLTDHPMLMLGLSLTDSTLNFVSGQRRQSVAPSKQLTSNDVQPLLAAARASVGIAVLPSFMVSTSVPEYGLLEVLPAWSMPDIAVSALTPSTRGNLPAVIQLLALLKKTVQAGTTQGT